MNLPISIPPYLFVLLALMIILILFRSEIRIVWLMISRRLETSPDLVKSGFLFVEEYEVAKQKGFSDKRTMDRVTALGYTTMTEYRQAMRGTDEQTIMSQRKTKGHKKIPIEIIATAKLYYYDGQFQHIDINESVAELAIYNTTMTSTLRISKKVSKSLREIIIDDAIQITEHGFELPLTQFDLMRSDNSNNRVRSVGKVTKLVIKSNL